MSRRTGIIIILLEIAFVIYTVTLPEPPLPKEPEPWVVPPPLNTQSMSDVEGTITKSYQEYPEYYDEDAGHWEEFLEDAEMLGIDPFSIDGQDYYELNY